MIRHWWRRFEIGDFPLTTEHTEVTELFGFYFYSLKFSGLPVLGERCGECLLFGGPFSAKSAGILTAESSCCKLVIIQRITRRSVVARLRREGTVLSPLTSDSTCGPVSFPSSN